MSRTSLTFASFDAMSFSVGVLRQRFIERHVERRRNLLGNPVDIGVRQVERTAHVAHHRLRLHGSEGNDLSHVFTAVFPRDVVDDLSAAPFAEIDVDVRERYPFWVQEALKNQIEAERIDVGNAHRPGNERSGRGSPAGADRNVLPRARSG